MLDKLLFLLVLFMPLLVHRSYHESLLSCSHKSSFFWTDNNTITQCTDWYKTVFDIDIADVYVVWSAKT
jgi:hypothetical protein